MAIIVLNIEKKLWLPIELETVNNRNTSGWFQNNGFSTDQVVVILFDDKTQFLLRQNGMPIKDFERKGRDLINLAVNKLESYKVRSIGLNLNLNSPSTVESDEKLISTILKYKNIVIADSIYSLSAYPFSNILSSTKDIGYGELYADYDKIVHKIKLIDKSYKELPSFSFALYKNVTGNKNNLGFVKQNEVYLRYYPSQIIKYSFIDLIHGKINPKDLKGKIVILGVGLKSKLVRDQLLSPYLKGTFISDSEVQATSIANLLNGSYLFKSSLSDYRSQLVILSILLGVIFSNIPILRGVILFSLLLTLEIIAGHFAYNYSRLLIDLVPFLFVLTGDFIVGSLIFLQLNLHEQNVELAEALKMLSRRTSELEVSQKELENKNAQLSGTLAELNKRVSELKEVRKQLSVKSEEERKRISRELHDDTLARITDLKIYIESIISSDSIKSSEKKQLGSAIIILDNVTVEIRRIINALRPSMLDNALGFIPAIESLLDELSKRSNYKIHTKLTTKLSKIKLSELGEINLYRIIQEALNNVFKHSNANKVEIVIEEQPGQVLILLHDNGIGFKTNKDKKGFGLIDIKERADIIGAAVQYINRPNNTGTTLEIAIPLTLIIKIEKTADEIQQEQLKI